MCILNAVMGSTIVIGIVTGPCLIGAQVGTCIPEPGQATCIPTPGKLAPPDSKPRRFYIIAKGNPYSGVLVVHHVYVSPDGSRQEDGSSTMRWRDSEGRERTDVTWKGLDGNDVTACQIDDPIALVRYIWKVGKTVKTAVTETHYTMEDGIVEEIWPDPVHEHKPEPGSGVAIVTLRPQEDPNTTSETLGPKYINGVYAEGSRSVELIPPGRAANGTDHPIKRIDEIWMSSDLGMPVKTLLDDGLGFTESTELKNIDRSEPDPSVFEPPPGLPKRVAPESDPVWKETIGAN